MSPGKVAGWVARRLPAADDDHRVELAESVASTVADRARCDRAWETASLVGLWLRLWGRREGGDDARLAVRQGVHLAGVVLLFVASAMAWSHAAHGDAADRAGWAGPTAAVIAVVAAGLASGAAVLAAGGWRAAGLALSIGALVAGVIAGGPSPAVGVAAVVAVLIGDRFGGRRCWRGLAAGALIAAVLAGMASAAPPDLLPAGAATALLALPLGLLVVGWFDPRFAVAATVGWLGAMIGIADHAWPQVVADAAWPPGRYLWWALVVAVVASGHVARAALRRAFAI
jgi:hypothetical protein